MVAHMMKRSADPKPDAVPGTTFLPPTEDDEFMCRRCYASDACMLYRKVRVYLYYPLAIMQLISDG